MKRYTLLLIPDPEEGGYTATVPALLPGCITEGDTSEETLENARDAIRL
ncbi:MAG: type II toxin-antitoxin system HicB family antitoxin [Dehalococcoidia bacterium]|nr:type II toxin-antitoxin system HicB family antitoxin [Dehalococcoidia bacterium]